MPILFRSLLAFLLVLPARGALAQSVADSDVPRDPNGRTYRTVTIGHQSWMAENLDTDRFANGEVFPEARTPAEWDAAREAGAPVWAYYDGDPRRGESYGRLYNREAVQDRRGLCPDGWRVPSNEDWKELERHLGLTREEADAHGWRGVIGGDLRSRRTAPEAHPRWDAPNVGATDASGFSALPGGYRTGQPNYAEQRAGAFNRLGAEATFWASEGGGRAVAFDREGIFRGGPGISAGFGFAVRCVR